MLASQVTANGHLGALIESYCTQAHGVRKDMSSEVGWQKHTAMQ
jgi:hypothetical protein